MNTEQKMQKAIDILDERLKQIRAGRANPAMLKGIQVEYYGAKTPIESLANITVPEARQLFIKPFDKSCLKDMEKAIQEANLGINPTNNGEMLIMTVPELTQDRRREYVKDASKMVEEAKVAIRKVRQEENEDVKALELPEDEEKQELENIQELTNKYIKICDDKMKEKETELLSF